MTLTRAIALIVASAYVADAYVFDGYTRQSHPTSSLKDLKNSYLPFAISHGMVCCVQLSLSLALILPFLYIHLLLLIFIHFLSS